MLLSIIVPVKNEEKTIATMLGFLRDELTAFPYELIVADGGSTDRTVAIAKTYATVVEYRGDERKTIGWGRNQGAKEARGDFLVFIDAGVRIREPNAFFEKALGRFSRDPKLAGLTAKIRVLPPLATPADRLFSALADWTHWLNNNVIGRGSASGKFQMLRAETFRAVGGYRNDLVVYEDNEFFYRLSRKAGRTRIAMDLVVYHPGRRAHAVGWPRLLWLWIANWFSATFFDRSASRTWDHP